MWPIVSACVLQACAAADDEVNSVRVSDVAQPSDDRSSQVSEWLGVISASFSLFVELVEVSPYAL